MTRLNGGVVVTGAASGIGRASALLFAEMGADVVGVDRNADGLATLPDHIRKVTADVTNAEECLKAIQTATDGGPLTGLFNCAGQELHGTVVTMSEGEFDTLVDVNLKAIFLMCKHAIPAMEAAGGGSIVNMSSINARVAIPAIPAYCASKGGLMQLTRAAALALAPHGIRVNAVGPGSIDTEMMAGVNANPEAMATAMSRTPLKRMGLPREVGDVVAFLASAKAGYITGETVYVDGGRLGLNYTC